jgi:5'-3' exonuclease
VGDTVDNIGGIKGKGPAFAFKLLHDLETERQCYEHVAEVYIKAHGDNWKEKLLEQARLLHMVRELNEDGSPKMWLPPRKDKE